MAIIGGWQFIIIAEPVEVAFRAAELNPPLSENRSLLLPEWSVDYMHLC